MFISDEKDQISFSSENGLDVLKCSDDVNGFSQIISPLNVVPEHTQSDLDQLMSTLEEEIVRLRSEQKKFDEKRRSLLNKILDIKGSIRVFCRIRPLSSNTNRKTEAPILVDCDNVVVKSAGIKKEFDFDKVFCQNSTQEDVFVEVEPILRSALDGHNVCVLAYGQTGTGKTFTMEGTSDQPGVVPRALKELFRHAALETTSSITFSMSMLEVYMGNLKDLLAPRPSRNRVYEPITRCNLTIQADSKGVVDIEGLTEIPISDFSKAKWWYAKGRRARATSSTSVNDASSRSHCLTRITICHHGDASSEGEARTSKLWMVDLGGSERLLKTGATGLTLDEGRAINLSLSALADVVASLRRRRPHVPYRNSKLTQILRDSLGNDSKVLMIVHISSVAEDLGETVCSMSFAKRARAIETNQELAEDLKNQKRKKIAEFCEEMNMVEEEYRTIRNQLQKAELLLRENKRVHSAVVEEVIDEDSTKIDKDVDNTVLDTDITSKRKSLPHYMTSTAASRAQRQSTAENHFTAKVLRSGTRSSVPLSASQSLSFMEPRLKAVLKNGSKPHQQEKVGNDAPVVTDTQNHHAAEPSFCSTPRRKSVTPSFPTSRPAVPRHKRRVSSLI